MKARHKLGKSPFLLSCFPTQHEICGHLCNLWTTFPPNLGGAPAVNNKKNRDKINEAMTYLSNRHNAGGNYQLEEIDLSGFTPLP